MVGLGLVSEKKRQPPTIMLSYRRRIDGRRRRRALRRSGRGSRARLRGWPLRRKLMWWKKKKGDEPARINCSPTWDPGIGALPWLGPNWAPWRAPQRALPSVGRASVAAVMATVTVKREGLEYIHHREQRQPDAAPYASAYPPSDPPRRWVPGAPRRCPCPSRPHWGAPSC